MNAQEKKERLRTVLSEYLQPHCHGCDGWMCEHVPGEEEELLEDTVNAVLDEISTWGDGDVDLAPIQ